METPRKKHVFPKVPAPGFARTTSLSHVLQTEMSKGSKKTLTRRKSPPPECSTPPQTQPIDCELFDEKKESEEEPILEDKTLSSTESMEEDPEESFREHCADALRTFGVDVVSTWFKLECLKVKKPKLDKQKIL